MAIEAIKELVTKFQSIQAQIAEEQAELEKQRKKHLDFWRRFQKKCSETGHSLTQEEREALAEYNKPDTRPYWLRTIPMATDNYEHASLTQFDIHISNLSMHGYRCAYCLRRVSGRVEYWGPKLDLCKRESFDKWIGFQEDERPPEKVDVLDKARKELEDFFGKAEPLEQEIETLKKEEGEIQALLESVWEILDKALGKDVQRREEKEALCDDYEEKIRATEALIPGTYDRDAYYND